MEEMLLERHEEREQNYYAFSRCIILPEPPCVWGPKSSLNLILLIIVVLSSLHRLPWLNHWPLAIEFISSSPPLTECSNPVITRL